LILKEAFMKSNDKRLKHESETGSGGITQTLEAESEYITENEGTCKPPTVHPGKDTPVDSLKTKGFCPRVETGAGRYNPPAGL
jgi:hypothetical protein